MLCTRIFVTLSHNSQESPRGVWLLILGASSHLLLQPTSSVSSVSLLFKDIRKQPANFGTLKAAGLMPAVPELFPLWRRK